MIDDILKDKVGLFADGVQTILRGHENRVRKVSMVNGNLMVNNRSEERGISARVMKNGCYGFASSAEYTGDAAEEVIRAATKNADFLSARAAETKKAPGAAERTQVPAHGAITDPGQDRMIEACRKIDDYLKTKYPDLTSRTVQYREDSQDKIIYTSDASCGRVLSPRCYIYVWLSAETPSGTPVEVFKPFGGYGSFSDNFTDTDWILPGIDQLYQRLQDKRNGVYPEAGEKTVILSGYMAGMLAHEAVGHTVEADLVLGGSVGGPNLGKRVGSDLVSLVDFAHTAFGTAAPLPIWLDDEGVPAKDAILIQNGILKGYMNNRETAAYFGMEPCGNARAWSFSDEPIIRMRNTFLLPGTSRLDDMIASVDDGYYLIQSGNGQADLTGEFMFGVTEGYEIKHGKLGRALLDTTVTGVAFEMLKTVDMVSDHVRAQSSGFCGKKQRIPVSLGGPEVRCRITIGGR
ncbi:MAG: TldD/PmbA family protein [Lachnospiraceae bacterium]|jgi:TldD protein